MTWPILIPGFERVPASRRKFMRTVQLFVTSRCDMSCKFCFRRSKGFVVPEMSLSDALGVIDRHSHEDFKLSITGGEPTLWGPLDLLLSEARLRGIETEVYTNGRHGFDPHGATVKLRYDGLMRGEKRMCTIGYDGSYELGLLVDGTNFSELVSCIDEACMVQSFSGVVGAFEVVGADHLPLCGLDEYSRQAEAICRAAAERPLVRRIEVSMNGLGVDVGVPRCRFVRYFDGRCQGTCPHDKDPAACVMCHFQKDVYERVRAT